jgi:hypothetical protein
VLSPSSSHLTFDVGVKLWDLAAKLPTWKGLPNKYLKITRKMERHESRTNIPSTYHHVVVTIM